MSKLLDKCRHLVRPVHIGACLVLMSLCVLFVADMLGFRDNGKSSISESRKALVESVAMHLSTLVNIDDKGAIDYAISSLVTRNAEVQAASLIKTNGFVIAQYGENGIRGKLESVSSLSEITVPIMNDRVAWGELRLIFESTGSIYKDILGFLFYIAGSLIAFSFLLAKAFIQLDPNRAVPGRVETALNLFASGVVILDSKMRIIMINQAACEMSTQDKASLIGSTLDKWSWLTDADWQAPWTTTFRTGLVATDQPLKLSLADGSQRLVMVSCGLVGDENDGARGVIVSLDDMSSIEKKNSELSVTLQELRRSQDLLSAKNKELERLATTDSLTGITNRRVLMERLTHEFGKAKSENTPLSCIMTDIDHFKSVNDTYGHGAGDDVIRAVASTLQDICGKNDFVGRYGGEEFLIILPGIDAIAAAERAEQARAAVVLLARGGRLTVPKLSSSFGVADMTSNAADSASLVDFSDQALYVAKQNGRNRVHVHNEKSSRTEFASEDEHSTSPSENLQTGRLFELETMISERDREIENLREFDTLTGIPMRAIFLQRVESEIDKARSNGKHVGVLFFELRDLDRLVSVFGHIAIDSLLVSVVERLQNGLRQSDLVSAIAAEHSLSRISSNEFGVLLTDLVGTDDIDNVITRVKRLLSKPFRVEEQKVYVGANIGIALSRHDDRGATALVGKASDARLQAAEKPDKVSHVFANTTLSDNSHSYISLESDLHEALEAGHLQVYYQPKFDLVQRQVVSMEALLRWPHTTRGFVPPDIFIAIAEANGLIEPLSKFVIDTTLEQIISWGKMGFNELCVSVNVSPMQLRTQSVVEGTLISLEQAGVDGQHLELELTETSVLDSPESAIVALEKLRSAGIGISIDDFGTGYTSLSLLSKLPIDIIKIDRSFISAMSNSSRDRLIVQSIISMAHTLELKVVCEGVETIEQLETLTDIGCDVVQGYLISHALPADEMTEFLEKQRSAAQARRA